MLCYHFPPLKTISLRNYYSYLEFCKHFQSVQVITTSNQQVLQQERLPINGEAVYLAKTFDYRTALTLYKKKTVNQPETSKKNARWLLIKLLDSVPFNLIFGEGGLLYILSAFFKAGKLLKKYQITHLHTSYRPLSDHFAAFLIKVFHPQLFWIADFRDLPVDPVIRNVYFPSFQSWFIKKLIAKANVVTTVSRGLQQHLLTYHTHAVILRNGISFKNRKTIATEPYDRFTVAYTGSLFQDKRDPGIFLEVLAGLTKSGTISRQDIKILYAGKDGASWRAWLDKYCLNDIFEDKGIVPLEEALRIQQSAHINLLLTYASSKMTGNLTGKLFEYLSAGKPIVISVKGCRDEEVEEIISETNAGLVVYDDSESKLALQNFLQGEYDNWKKGNTRHRTNESNALEAYSWENTIFNFLNKEVFHHHLEPAET